MGEKKVTYKLAEGERHRLRGERESQEKNDTRLVGEKVAVNGIWTGAEKGYLSVHPYNRPAAERT